MWLLLGWIQSVVCIFMTVDLNDYLDEEDFENYHDD